MMTFLVCAVAVFIAVGFAALAIISDNRRFAFLQANGSCAHKACPSLSRLDQAYDRIQKDPGFREYFKSQPVTPCGCQMNYVPTPSGKSNSPSTSSNSQSAAGMISVGDSGGGGSAE